MKIWYGKQFSEDGTVYKQFVTLTAKEALTTLKRLRDTNKSVNTNSSGKDVCNQRWLNKAIKREGNYMFLNLTQAEFILGEKPKRNVAIYIKG